MNHKLTVLAAVLAGLAFAGCSSATEVTTNTHTAASPTISKHRAESIWLHYFRGYLVAGEGQTMATHGVEQSCEAKDGGWSCSGVIPEEESPFPSKDTNCLIAGAFVTGTGRLTDKSAMPLSQVREAVHAEAECHL